MTKEILRFFVFIFLVVNQSTYVNAQVSINTDGSSPDSTAILDVKSTTKGMLIPRMTEAQIGSITSPASGLQVFNTDDGKIYIYVSSESVWKEIAYGSGEILPPFNCGDSLSYEGQSYSTVQIGTQCWMGENINVGTHINASTVQGNNSIIEKYCYNDSEDNCDDYGGLYQWNEMMQYVTTEGSQGICPNGWHVPTDAEWKTLEGTVDSLYGLGDPEWNNVQFRGFDAGKRLKAITGWNENGNGTNMFGFLAYPGGGRDYYAHKFDGLGYHAFWWSSTVSYGSYAYRRYLYYNSDEAGRVDYIKDGAFSVRCLKD